eukprot:CAMPEP_0118954578 /NCGR_PEP_ID=MMETSP1169-20130426/58483_1 /TAXON_ID=36882 /ORGANISM="Pyramimonas obovata, Strain CCMP722" /LENGTH=217 /DNA_ID=CAMNT_0006902235 /DNA_START=277 /DNA_END=927 /DNA_ORIENTATION=+
MESLQHAIAALYYSNCDTERRTADVWLQDFLHSDQAWPLSLQLLRQSAVAGNSASRTEALFCARALHVLLRCSVNKAQKRQKSHVVLAEEDWVTMRMALVVLAGTFAADLHCSRPVLTQIALALSTLALKMSQWAAHSIVPDLIAMLATSGGEVVSSSASMAGLVAATEVLRVLPEEAGRREVSMHPARRADVVEGLRVAAPTAFALLHRSLTAQPE